MVAWNNPPGEKRPDNYCLTCGRRISPGRSGRRKFCSNACRQTAYRKRQAGVTLISVTQERKAP